MIGRGPATAAQPGRRPEGWGAHHDARLLATQGRYAAIAALAGEWGWSSRVLHARWQRLRGEAARAARKPARAKPPARPEPLTFESLLLQVRPSERDLLRVLREVPGCGYDDLARRTDRSKAVVQQYLKRMAPLLARAGWALVKAEDVTPRPVGGGRPMRLWLEPVA